VLPWRCSTKLSKPMWFLEWCALGPLIAFALGFWLGIWWQRWDNEGEAMTYLQLKALCELLMVSDPFPLDANSEELLKGLADKEAKQHGFDTWIDAFHGPDEKEVPHD